MLIVANKEDPNRNIDPQAGVRASRELVEFNRNCDLAIKIGAVVILVVAAVLL